MPTSHACGVAAIQHFAERIRAFVPSALAHAEFLLHTSLIEGTNNKVRVISLMVYGSRDDEYFFPKIRVAYLFTHRIMGQSKKCLFSRNVG